MPLTAAEIARFDAEGVLHLPHRLPASALSALQQASAHWLSDRAHRQGRGGSVGSAETQVAGQSYTYRINNLERLLPTDGLALLGEPALLEVAERLCGPSMVPNLFDMVIKTGGDQMRVEWHQDAIHPRDNRMIVVGVYLDDSVAGAGALEILPRTHQTRQDIGALTTPAALAEAEAQGRGVQALPAQAGDLLVHDVMIVHSSPPAAPGGLRRVIYVEFRDAHDVIKNGPQGLAWVQAQMRLLRLGLTVWQQANPDQPPYPWRPDPQFLPGPAAAIEQELTTIANAWQAGWGANYG
jgi:hypothetical protein